MVYPVISSAPRPGLAPRLVTPSLLGHLTCAHTWSVKMWFMVEERCLNLSERLGAPKFYLGEASDSQRREGSAKCNEGGVFGACDSSFLTGRPSQWYCGKIVRPYILCHVLMSFPCQQKGVVENLQKWN